MKLLFPLLMSMPPAASVAQSQLPLPEPNIFNLPFVVSVFGAFIASFVVARLYVFTPPSTQDLKRRCLPSVAFTPAGPLVYNWQLDLSTAPDR
jgi:hypothetical protein